MILWLKAKQNLICTLQSGRRKLKDQTVNNFALADLVGSFPFHCWNYFTIVGMLIYEWFVLNIKTNKIVLDFKKIVKKMVKIS